MTSRAQMPLVRGRSHSKNLTFSALLCEQNVKQNKSVRRRNKKNQEHRNIATLTADSFAVIKTKKLNRS